MQGIENENVAGMWTMRGGNGQEGRGTPVKDKENNDGIEGCSHPIHRRNAREKM